jgi:hypothetical protein
MIALAHSEKVAPSTSGPAYTVLQCHIKQTDIHAIGTSEILIHTIHTISNAPTAVSDLRDRSRGYTFRSIASISATRSERLPTPIALPNLCSKARLKVPNAPAQLRSPNTK